MMDFVAGWNLVQCTNFKMELIDGVGSLFATSDMNKFDFKGANEHCEHQYGMKPDFDFVL